MVILKKFYRDNDSMGNYGSDIMKLIKKTIVLLCVAMMLFSMSGCRDSSVLERIIYDYLRANQTDMEKNVYDDIRERELDDKLHDLEKEDESDRDNEAEEVDPVQDPNQESSQPESAGDPNYRDNANGADAAQVDPVPSSDAELSGAPSTGDAEGTGAADNSGSGTVPDNGGDVGVNGSDSIATRFVVDTYGKSYEVPQNVDSVAAVDSAALVVLMLGGVDRLAATDEDLTSDPLARDVFPGLSDVPALWTGNGTGTSLSSSALQRLIELHPDVCFETSGSATFSSAQVAALRENGIYYVPLPAPSGVDDLKLITEIIGKVLGDHTSEGGYDSVSRYRTYCSWVDDTLSNVAKAGGSAAYTIYVDGWDEDAYYTIAQASACYGYGAAVINNGEMESCQAVTDFLGEALVTNVTGLGSFGRTESIYFTPIDFNQVTINVEGAAAGRLTPLKLLSYGGALGTDHFQTVIVGSQSVKTELENNYLWTSFDYILSADRNFWDYGFLDDSGKIVPTTVHGEYDVIVNPRGIGAWAAGSVESVLETVWASYAIAGGYSESDMRAAVTDFYQTFYNYSLSDKQVEAILAGEP